MSATSPALRRFVRYALVAATNDAAPDGAQLRAAFEVLCDQLGCRLRPLFGQLARGALFSRALRLAQAEFPWLEGVTAETQNHCALVGLDAGSRDLPPHVLAEGLAAVLAHEIALLSAFIGEDIVLPLVEQSWGAASLNDRTAAPEGES